MKRPTTVLRREQRAMTQARTAGRRRRHDDEHPDIEDARDVEERALAAERAPRQYCRLMTPSANGWREVARADTLTASITLANMANARVVVFDIRTGKQVYDNRK